MYGANAVGSDLALIENCWRAAGTGDFNPQVTLQAEEFAEFYVALGGGFVFDQQAGAEAALRGDQFVVFAQNNSLPTKTC